MIQIVTTWVSTHLMTGLIGSENLCGVTQEPVGSDGCCWFTLSTALNVLTRGTSRDEGSEDASSFGNISEICSNSSNGWYTSEGLIGC